MNRADVLAARDYLRDKKNIVMEGVMARLDVKMCGQSVSERLRALIYDDFYTEEEEKVITELDVKIDGYTHMLKEGFFKPKRIPKKDDDLY